MNSEIRSDVNVEEDEVTAPLSVCCQKTSILKRPSDFLGATEVDTYYASSCPAMTKMEDLVDHNNKKFGTYKTTPVPIAVCEVQLKAVCCQAVSIYEDKETYWEFNPAEYCTQTIMGKIMDSQVCRGKPSPVFRENARRSGCCAYKGQSEKGYPNGFVANMRYEQCNEKNGIIVALSVDAEGTLNLPVNERRHCRNVLGYKNLNPMPIK